MSTPKSTLRLILIYSIGAFIFSSAAILEVMYREDMSVFQAISYIWFDTATPIVCFFTSIGGLIFWIREKLK